jgi:mannitol/fructose-specific phosphotransferase system IIA component (Ntr-type)
MVSLAVTLQPERVIEIQSTDKVGALRELVAAAARSGEAVDEAALHKAVLEREELSSTAFGDGLAMPHVRLPGIKRFLTVLGRANVGIDFAAQDGQPVRLLLLIVGPEPKREDYLKLMGRAAKFLKHERDRLLALQDFGKAATELAVEY